MSKGKREEEERTREGGERRENIKKYIIFSNYSKNTLISSNDLNYVRFLLRQAVSFFATCRSLSFASFPHSHLSLPFFTPTHNLAPAH